MTDGRGGGGDGVHFPKWEIDEEKESILHQRPGGSSLQWEVCGDCQGSESKG